MKLTGFVLLLVVALSDGRYVKKHTGNYWIRNELAKLLSTLKFDEGSAYDYDTSGSGVSYDYSGYGYGSSGSGVDYDYDYSGDARTSKNNWAKNLLSRLDSSLKSDDGSASGFASGSGFDYGTPSGSGKEVEFGYGNYFYSDNAGYGSGSGYNYGSGSGYEDNGSASGSGAKDVSENAIRISTRRATNEAMRALAARIAQKTSTAKKAAKMNKLKALEKALGL